MSECQQKAGEDDEGGQLGMKWQMVLCPDFTHKTEINWRQFWIF